MWWTMKTVRQATGIDSKDKDTAWEIWIFMRVEIDRADTTIAQLYINIE